MRQVVHPLVGVLLLSVGGCHDLETVESLSAKVVAASSVWDDVGRELERSCNRSSQFDPEQSCANEVLASNGVVAADLILRNYFNALHDAADGRKTSIDSGLIALAGSVADIPGIDSGKTAAASSLAEFLAKMASAAARQATVSQLLARSVEARDVISVLRHYVGAALSTTLTAESIQLKATYATYISQTAGSPPPRLDVICDGPGPRVSQFNGIGFLLATDYCRRTARIAAERVALTDYDNSLKAADAALVDLKPEKGRRRTKETAKQVFGVGKELDGDVAAVRKAFSAG